MPGSRKAGVPGNRPIVLIGPMAVGKSAIGHELAKLLDVPFVDTDSLIVDAHGSIASIFAGRGEHAFREIEAGQLPARWSMQKARPA
ncbi:shikimate kinase [Arthrobacter sp. Hiyo4]|nr:shikimate kinase [Arthrobacter sp. Hiyo4]